MRALLTFLPLYRRRLGALLLALLLSLVTIVSGVGLLGTSGWFITASALTTAGLAFNLFVPSAGVRAFSFVRILARYGERLIGHDATLRLLSDLRGWLFAALFPRLPLPDRSLRHGDLVSRLTADVDALDTAFLVAVGPLVSAVVVGAGMTAVMVWLLPGAALPYGLAMAAAALVVPTLMVVLGRNAGRRSVEANAELRAQVLDGVAGHADLTLLGVLGTAVRRFAGAGLVASGERLRLGGLATAGGFAVQVLAALALVGTLLAGLDAVAAGRLEGPVMAGLLLAVLASFEVTSTIVRSVSKATSAMAAAERLQALAALPPAVAEPTQPQVITPDASIGFDRVTFGYGSLPPVLDDFSLAIGAGERVAISGPSGAGKSTILRLLLRLAEPRQGQVTLGGTKVDQFATADLHAHMALLSQDSPVFIDTVRNNLLIGRDDASDEELWAALGKAQLEEHVASLPRGLDTLIGEAGRTLSAGQARRLCLARALVSAAPVLLLDEPTDALDRETELAFFETLAEATKGRTVVLVTHASLPEGTVDKIYTLRGGRLR
ncbi:thiol reductant ABC exporter subunit CydC [Devosia aurantiaca]|uniref:Thiol reductant ABC exporter subunit CydC n=1 Tax=Devosia aurantiaca TaxID=2714858 RepID=A0A6M1SPN8_9HYPH|nr:thiol reductant ABC exporter subunit CydC [Devosia aurantiaca]NGP18634.1 thiol reductant ABC exporter subunit CydC [Devosia aurantiaca]